jgi:hypothetical protein
MLTSVPSEVRAEAESFAEAFQSLEKVAEANGWAGSKFAEDPATLTFIQSGSTFSKKAYLYCGY